MENWRYMMRSINRIIFLFMFPLGGFAQEAAVFSLDTILNRIDQNSLLLQGYALKAESYKHKADAATAWMAPMIGAGTFMTPYPGQELMSDNDKGSLMFQAEQSIPNPAKQKAKRQYIESQSEVEMAGRGVALNNLKAQARNLYFSWLIAEKRIAVLKENDKLMEMMKKIEEIRYPYNRSQLAGVYQATAKLEENKNMILMQEGEIGRARAWLNSLMNLPADHAFNIDPATAIRLSAELADTASLAARRYDILRMDKSIESMKLGIQSMKTGSKPDFSIRLDHMSPLGKMMPNSYSIMGMISIPIAPWSSGMYKSEVKGMQYEIQAMEREREGMLQETQGMLHGMRYEIASMQRRIESMEQKIIPSLRKTMEAYFVSYQENRQDVRAVIDAWEALNMMQMNVLDEKLKLFQMIISYEKELYR